MKVKFTKRNLVISLVILTLLLIAGWFFIGNKKTTKTPPAESTLVQLSPVKISTVPVVIKATGDLLPNQQVEITPQTAGYVKAILFTEGSFAKKESVLVQLDDRQQQEKVLEQKAIFELSQENYARNLKLKKEVIISPQDLDKLKSLVMQNEATLRTAQTTLNQMTLRAPFSGFLGEKSISVGDYIQPGTKVVTLTDISHLKITYDIPARFSGDLKLGQPVKIISNTFPEKIFYGKVSYISPTINEDNQTITIHALLDNKENSLKPGEFVTLSQTLSQINDAVLVPENAILGDINGYYVLQVKAGKVISTPIKPGEHYEGDVLILSGLKKGDKIITAGQHQVKVGDPVRVTETKTEAAQ